MRVCAKDACGTHLSRYNPAPLCHPHNEQVLTPLLRWLRPQAWHAQAKCSAYGTDPETPFYAEPYSTMKDALESHAIRKAKSMCASCPVRRNCLADVLTWEPRLPSQGRAKHYATLPGIWGGTLPEERRRAHKLRRSLPLEDQLDLLLKDMMVQARLHGLIARERFGSACY